MIYATETGRSEKYAKQLVELFGHAFNAQVSGHSRWSVSDRLFLWLWIELICRFIQWLIMTFHRSNTRLCCWWWLLHLAMATHPRMERWVGKGNFFRISKMPRSQQKKIFSTNNAFHLDQIFIKNHPQNRISINQNISPQKTILMEWNFWINFIYSWIKYSS